MLRSSSLAHLLSQTALARPLVPSLARSSSPFVAARPVAAPTLLSISSIRPRPSLVRPQARAYSDGPGHPGNDPTGYIFGERPPPPGQRRPKEVWEYIMVWPTFFLIIAFCTINYYKANQLDEWAWIEAKRRMKERGEYPVYTPSMPAGVNYNPEWNGFLGRLPTDEELKK